VSEIARNVVGPACHGDWHDYLRERLSYDNWRTDEALLLLAGIWPIEAEISNSSVSSPRYGVIEPPVVIHAGLLDQECSIQFRDDYQRLLILAGRRLRLIRELWESGNHMDARYPPAYFAQWAESKNLTPCWLNIWQEHLAMAKHTMSSQASLSQVLDGTPTALGGTAMASVMPPGTEISVSPAATPNDKKKHTNKWGERELRQLLEMSNEPGMTHQKLADVYGVTRQLIGRKLQTAKPKKARPFGVIDGNRRK